MRKAPDLWDCHSIKTPNRQLPAWALQDRNCGFWHADSDNPSMADELRRCEGCKWGPERDR